MMLMITVTSVHQEWILIQIGVKQKHMIALKRLENWKKQILQIQKSQVEEGNSTLLPNQVSMVDKIGKNIFPWQLAGVIRIVHGS